MADPLLSIFSHYASLSALLCSVVLLVFHRKEPAIYGIIIAAAIGGIHSLVLILGNYEVVNYVPVSLEPVNLAGGTLVAMLLCYFPMALVNRKLLTWPGTLLFVVPCIAQILLLTLASKAGIEYRTLGNVEDIARYIGEPNVWIRLIAFAVPYLFYIFPLVYISFQWRHAENRDILLFCSIAFFIMGIFFTLSNLLAPQPGRAINAIYSTLVFVSLTIFLSIRDRKKQTKAIATHPPLPYLRPETAPNSHCHSRPTDKPSTLPERLKAVMNNNKPHLDPELTLPQLAALTNTNRTTLSALLRSQGYENFSNYLNAYRVAEACQMMDQGFEGKLADLYLNVGFNNKNTFTRNFARVTGLTPGQYLKQKAGNPPSQMGE